uniref:Beta-glucosidase n=1 Tax=uncultured prokaryote TaxID=198431 RepID=A0A0H5Q1N7_9ZZZZ|nr:hypothetical protein [uncultured prokaryote]
MIAATLLAATGQLAYGAQTRAKKQPVLNADNIDRVVKSMTLEQKANLIVGMSRRLTDEERAGIGYTARIIPGAAGTTYPIENMGITPVVLADGPAGLRIDPTRKGESRTYYGIVVLL